MSWLSERTGVDWDINHAAGQATGVNGYLEQASNIVNGANDEQARLAREAEEKRLKDEAEAALKKRNDDALAEYTRQYGGLGQIGQVEGTGLSMESNPEYYVKSQNEFGMIQGQDSSNAPITGLSGLSAMQGQGNQGSSYPAMANDYGLGQAQAAPGAASSPSFGATDISVTVPDASSRGFNPWSLQGEALSRR
jgi:hypothetical protein